MKKITTLIYQFTSPFSTRQPSNGKPKPLKPFDPVSYGLSKDFVLTNFTKMKG